MRNLKAIHIFILIAASGLILLAALAGLFILRLPEADQLVPSGSSPFVVTITGPQSGASFAQGSFATVTSQAFGIEPVSALQLWVDGVLMETKKPKDFGNDHFYAYWIWSPAVAGEHVLTVAASGPDGSTTYSNPVHVLVRDPAAVDLAPFSPQEGDTLVSVAEKLELSLDDLAAANPDVGPGDVLPPDKPISIPSLSGSGLPPLTFPALPAPPSGDTTPAEGLEAGKLGLWLRLRFGGDTLPAPPVVSASLAGCDVHIYIADKSNNETGFFVYRTDLGGGYSRIGTIGENSAALPVEFLDKGFYGSAMYYVSAFNAAGESDSNPVGVTNDSSACKPSSSLSFRFEKLNITPSQAVDRMYCYFSSGGDLWSRAPAGDGRFVFPTGGVFNFTPYTGILPQNELTPAMECWGWRGGSLVDLGQVSGGVPSGDGAFELQAPGFAVTGSLNELDPGAPILTLYDDPPPIPLINAPVDLTRTSELRTCIDHFPDGFGKEFLGPLICSKAIPNGDLILVWDWSYCPFIFPVEGSKVTCADYFSEINGYKIYKYLPGKAPVLVGTIKDRTQTIFFFPGGDPGTPPPTFVVRAYAGPFESANSNPYVLAGTSSGTETVTILPVPFSENELSYFSDWTQKVVDDCDIDEMRGTGSEGDMGLGTDEIVVGFDHSSYDCVDLNDIYWRASLLFDISPVKGPVSSAVLKYKQGKTVSGGSDGYGTDGQSCADSLNISTAVSTAGISAFDPYRALSATGYAGYVHSVDVTEAIRDWMLGAPNVGFLFTGRDEGFPEENYACWSRYRDFVLTVTYFK